MILIIIKTYTKKVDFAKSTTNPVRDSVEKCEFCKIHNQTRPGIRRFLVDFAKSTEQKSTVPDTSTAVL
jgi:hypothetical protein